MSLSDSKPRRHLSDAPWHVLLGPILPLLVFYRGSASGATPYSIVWPLLFMVGFALLAWGGFTLLMREARRAALVATLLSLATFGYFAVSDLAEYVRLPAFVPLAYLAVPAAIVFVWLTGPRVLAWLTVGANGVLLVAVLLQGGLAIREERRVLTETAIETPGPLTGAGAAAARERPDIYVVILEGYGRADVLRETYGFDNDLVGSLRSLGFFVADRAAGNYPQLGHAMASALNLDYLPSMLDPDVRVTFRRRLGELIIHNRLFSALHAAGYRIVSYESEYAFLRPRPVDERPGPAVRFTNFEYRLYEASIVPRLLQAARLPRGLIPIAVRRRQAQWNLARLSNETAASDDRPTFVFAHLLMPHPPFVVQADGSARETRLQIGFNDGDLWRELAGGSGERYEAGYVDAVKFLNSHLPDAVGRVLQRSTRPAIFYILSDHGPASRLLWERPDPASIRERMGILLAVRFPDGDHGPIHAGTTPVNAFRVLVNRALGMEMPMLDDRSYFSTWERVWEYTDVTGLMR